TGDIPFHGGPGRRRPEECHGKHGAEYKRSFSQPPPSSGGFACPSPTACRFPCCFAPSQPAWVRKGITGIGRRDRKSTRLNSSHVSISYAVFCLKKKKKNIIKHITNS